MGVAMSLGYYAQAWKMLTTKSAQNVSGVSFSIFSLGTTTWLIYGLIHNDAIIIISFALGVVGSWLVLILTFVYGRNHSSVENNLTK